MGSDDDGGRKSKSNSTCEWTPDAVFCLLDKYGEKYALGRGLLRNTDWEEVVQSVNSLCEVQKRPKTVKQCRDKIDSLKKRYKTEKTRLGGAGAMSSMWPFFEKLDEIITSVPKTARAAPKQAKLVTLLDVGRNASLAADEEEHPESSSDKGEESLSTRDSPTANSESEQGGSSQKKEKMAVDISADDELADDDSDMPSHSQKGSQDPVYGSCQKKMEQLSETILKVLAKKTRQVSPHPVQALADAIVGFSDVYARIELAKMEVYTDMQLEIAKLQNRTEKSRKRKAVPSSFSDSEMR